MKLVDRCDFSSKIKISRETGNDAHARLSFIMYKFGIVFIFFLQSFLLYDKIMTQFVSNSFFRDRGESFYERILWSCIKRRLCI